MTLLRTVVQYLAMASLVLAAAQVYLTLNKLWKRKHEPAVAESVSIMGEFIGLVPIGLLTLNFTLEGQWEGAIDGVLWVMAGTVTIAIGTGAWVEGRRNRSFFRLLREALALERGEVGYLARSFFRPSGASRILRILGQVALLDDRLDEREQRFIESFAESWGIELSWERLRSDRTGDHVDYVNLRRDVSEYLATSPPEQQVQQLNDVLVALIEIDEEVADEEAVIMGELTGMLRRYLDGGETDPPVYAVVLVPQDERQDRAIAALLSGVEKREVHGGQAYVAGTYHSREYAELVGVEYRALNFFTTVVRI